MFFPRKITGLAAIVSDDRETAPSVCDLYESAAKIRAQVHQLEQLARGAR